MYADLTMKDICWIILLKKGDKVFNYLQSQDLFLGIKVKSLLSKSHLLIDKARDIDKPTIMEVFNTPNLPLKYDMVCLENQYGKYSDVFLFAKKIGNDLRLIFLLDLRSSDTVNSRTISHQLTHDINTYLSIIEMNVVMFLNIRSDGRTAYIERIKRSINQIHKIFN